VLARSDRREWAVLGLVALAWCLLIAPVLHRETHAHGTQHAHQHDGGNFEHQSIAFLAPVDGAEVPGVWLALAPVGEVAPRPVVLISQRRVEQAQAP